jgi:NAD(P)-dependent dehydrogenase (short-subunit alcohol dehydrogenase family)
MPPSRSEIAPVTGASFPEPVRAPAHALAKHTLNVLTATLAAAFRGTAVRVNAVDPGPVATHPERGDDAGDRTPAAGAERVVWAATLPAGGPSGGVFLEPGRKPCR